MDFQVLDCGERSCFLTIVFVLFYSTTFVYVLYYCVYYKNHGFSTFREVGVCRSKQQNLWNKINKNHSHDQCV